MKQQHNTTRRSNSSRGSPEMIDGGSGESPTSILWLILHALCCLISLILGFRFSHLVFFLLFSPTSVIQPSSITTAITPPFFRPNSPSNKTTASRVVVGRHGIRIRPWPHPNPNEVMKAQKIMERVQKEQKVQYSVKSPRELIVVTPTYVRTFQAMHLTGVMHALMNAPYNVVWIVVEAGGVTNETASLIQKSRVQTIHVGFHQIMPLTWADRTRVQDLMRVHALRLIRDRKLDGIVMFADDSNMHSLELFDEVQRVKQIGALCVGILIHSDTSDNTHLQMNTRENGKGSLPIQGPVCNSSGNLVSWHTFNVGLHADPSAVNIGDVGTVLPKKMEWAGFVLNSRLLWRHGVDKPEWVNDLDSMDDESVEISPLLLVKDSSVVEPLGNCGRKVLVWWLRVEARPESKFPARWVINSPLEVTVHSKHNPLPDVPFEHAEKQSLKAQSRKHNPLKKKHDTKLSYTPTSSRLLRDKEKPLLFSRGLESSPIQTTIATHNQRRQQSTV